MSVSALLPTVGRTIHWQYTYDPECMVLRVTGLDYGPRAAEGPTIIGEHFNGASTVLPLSEGDWHYAHDHESWTQTHRSA